MAMQFYASPEQIMRDRSEYARKGISRGRSVVVLTYEGGVLFVAENPSKALHKVSEIYDRIGFAAARYLTTRAKVFELTNERLKTTQGVFSKVTDTLELYRVKDIETRQPFVSRMVGVENVRLTTSDASSPSILIDAIPRSVGLADKIRNQVEIIRQQKRVREIDIE